jgi:hypothetical protein
MLTCCFNDDSEALTAIVTDMASALNETFRKEESILITNGWKLDIAAMQRYVACGGVENGFFLFSTYIPANRKTKNCFLCLTRCENLSLWLY